MATFASDSLGGFVRGDIGGFGIGSSSDLAWNLLAGVEWAWSSCPGTSTMPGYRLFDIDRSSGSGIQAHRFDVLMHGPFLALGFRF